MRYWLTTLLGITLASAAVAVIAWCTRALIEHSLCPPAATEQPLACSAENGELGAAIGICALVVIPLASVIFAHRTTPRGTPLGALALGLAIIAAGGAALYAAIPSDDTTVQVSGYITAAVLLTIGPLMALGGMAATGARRTRTVAAADAPASSGETIADAISRASGGAVVLSAGDIRAGTVEEATKARAAASSTIGFGALAAQLAQISAAKQRTGADALAATLRQLDDLHAAGLLNSSDHARMRDEIRARVRQT